MEHNGNLVKRAKKNLNWLFFFNSFIIYHRKVFLSRGRREKCNRKSSCRRGAQEVKRKRSGRVLFLSLSFGMRAFVLENLFIFLPFGMGWACFSSVWLGFAQQQHSYNSRRAVVLKMASAKNGIRIIISIQNYIDKKVSISLPVRWNQ